MLKIRLTRRGKKNSAFFRVVVAENTSPIKGKFLENLGFFNPHTKEKEFKADRIKYWIEKGAQCSDTVHNLLVSNGVIGGSKRAVKIKQKPVEPAVAEVKEGEGKKEDAEAKSESATEANPEPASPAGKEKETEKSTEAKKEKTEEVKPEPEKEAERKKEAEEKK